MSAGWLLAVVVGVAAVLKPALPHLLWGGVDADDARSVLPLIWGALIMFVVYLVTLKVSPAYRASSTTSIGLTPHRRPSYRILLAFCIALACARIVLQQVVGLHVVGKEPWILLPGRGILYHLTGFGLLYAGALLLLESHGRPRTERIPLISVGAACILIFGALGALGGSRGALFFAALMSAAVVNRLSNRGLRGKYAVAVGALALAALVIAPVVTAQRGIVTANSSPATVLLSRLGGAEAFAPLVPYRGQLDLSDLVFDFTQTINTAIFALPYGTPTGFAVTAWGIGFLAGGIGGVVLIGVLLGGAAALMDSWGHGSHGANSTALYLTGLVIFVIFVQEGTVLASANSLLAVLALSAGVRVLSLTKRSRILVTASENTRRIRHPCRSRSARSAVRSDSRFGR